MTNDESQLNMREFEKLYSLTKMAVDTDDGMPNKEMFISAAEDEVVDLLREADRILLRVYGGEWQKRVVVISSSLSGTAMDNMSKQMDMSVMNDMTQEQSDVLYGTTKLASQVGLVIGFILALKAAGVWDELKSKYGGKE